MVRVLNIMGTLDCGGLETTVMNYYRNIDRSKIQFDFLLLGEGKGYYEDEAVSLGARIFRRPERSRNPVGLGFALFRILKKNSDINAIHIHHFSPKVAIDVAFAMWCKIPVRVVYSSSALPFLPFKRKIYRPLLRMITTHMMAGSMKAGVSMFGEKVKSKLIIAPRARDLKSFRYSPEKRKIIRERLGLGEHPTIICVGNLRPEKNQTFLLDVLACTLKKQPNLILLLVGYGIKHGEILDKSANLGLEDSVRFLGFRNDIPDLLQAADLFVMPSLNEGLPGATIEAQAAGLPCLLADTITAEVKIVDSVEFLPIDKGPEIWAERILSYQNFPRHDTTEELRLAGYDIRDAAKWLEDVYITALKEKGVAV